MKSTFNILFYLKKNRPNSNGDVPIITSVMKFIQRFKTVFDYIVNGGDCQIQLNPFNNFNFKYEVVNRGFLTQEEIDHIYTKQFASARLKQVQDVFVFSCYTSLAYIDVCELTKDNIKMAFDGYLWIMTTRSKTNIPSNIRLLDIPLAIIKRYENQQIKGSLLPCCSNQKMDEYLK